MKFEHACIQQRIKVIQNQDTESLWINSVTGMSLHANNPQRNQTIVGSSRGHYILSGAVIPRSSSDFSIVSLKELTKQRREFSKESSSKSKTCTCS